MSFIPLGLSFRLRSPQRLFYGNLIAYFLYLLYTLSLTPQAVLEIFSSSAVSVRGSEQRIHSDGACKPANEIPTLGSVQPWHWLSIRWYWGRTWHWLSSRWYWGRTWHWLSSRWYWGRTWHWLSSRCVGSRWSKWRGTRNEDHCMIRRGREFTAPPKRQSHGRQSRYGRLSARSGREISCTSWMLPNASTFPYANYQVNWHLPTP